MFRNTSHIFYFCEAKRLLYLQYFENDHVNVTIKKNKKEICKSVLFARLAADQHGLLIHVVNKFKPSWLLLSKQINDVFLLIGRFLQRYYFLATKNSFLYFNILQVTLKSWAQNVKTNRRESHAP